MTVVEPRPPEPAPTHESAPVPHGYTPPRPPRFRRRLSQMRALVTARQNLIAVWPDEAFAGTFLRQRFLFRELFVANSPETVRHVMVTKSDNYWKSRQMRRALEPLVGDGMFISNGDTWKRQRRMAVPAFHSSRLKAFAEAMVGAGLEMCDRWQAAGDGAELEITEEMTRVTAEIVCRTMFSDDLGAGNARAVFEGFAAYQETLSQVDYGELLGLPDWLPRRSSRKADRAAAGIHRIIEDIIETRRQSGDDKGDMLSILLSAHDDETDSAMTTRQLRDEMAVVFLAGHETTATALGWSLFLLSQDRPSWERLVAEVDRVLGGRSPGYDDIQYLAFTRCVIEEALRLYPPVAFFSREAMEDDEIDGQTIPKGSMVLVVPWLLHRHRRLWRDPDEFRPERFMPDKARGRPKFAFLPFGAGPRTCPGASFAMNESVLLLALIAQRFKLTLRPGHDVQPLCRLSLRPGSGLPMRLSLR